MAAAITMKMGLNAKGILDINDDAVSIENPDTGEIINLSTLLSDFADKSVKLSVVYDYDYGDED